MLGITIYKLLLEPKKKKTVFFHFFRSYFLRGLCYTAFQNYGSLIRALVYK